MADDIETVSVEAPQSRPRRPGYAGLSPLQAGLLYGGAASTVLGPLGPLIGLGFGIAAKRQRDSFLDREAKYTQDVQGRSDALQEQLDAEYEQADPDERRKLDTARRLRSDGYNAIMSGNPAGEEMLKQATAIILDIQGADSTQRKQDEAAAMTTQRQLIGDAAGDYRKQYQKTLDDNDLVAQRTGRVFDLLSQPGFDPNSPMGRAAVTELVLDGMGAYRDTPDAWDAISSGAGAFSGIAAAGVDAVAKLFKSEDFKMKREDVYRLALNMRQFAEAQTKARMERLGGQTQQLQGLARQTRALPADFNLGEYVSGGVHELPLLPIPQAAADTGLVDQARNLVDTPTEAIGTQRLSSGPTTRRRAPRPVNGAVNVRSLFGGPAL